MDKSKFYMKKRYIVGLLVFLLALIPSVSADTVYNQWFIDNAILGVESSYSLTGVSWNGVTSPVGGGENHGSGWHRHVNLDGMYGPLNRGEVDWYGEVDQYGSINTINYNNDPGTLKVTLLTTIKNPQYRMIWDGSQYVINTPITYWFEGRFWVVYPKP